MGKGDKKTKRGKIIAGSYGVRRPKKSTTSHVEIPKPEKVKKTPAKEAEVEEKKPVVKKTTTKKPAAKKPAAKKVAKKE
jgi:ribosomal small subunit protein bTHX